MDICKFYKNKTVLVTGHTGFKGSWICTALKTIGANVIGFSLGPPTEPALYELAECYKDMESITGDIRDYQHIKKIMNTYRPEIVIHMAAQPIVREGYEAPLYTYETNVMGTTNILEAIRTSEYVKSFINVTTDKVYQNKEWEWGYRENEELKGLDPYSNSKSCSELVTYSYQNSFFKEREVAISTVRAGNVIGGGDFARDRIIPDCFRAVQEGRKVMVRNPYSVRPYQHVIEAVMTYLMIAMEQYRDKSLAGNYNIGPQEDNCIETGRLVSLFCSKWEELAKETISWTYAGQSGPKEANFLKLDCSKIKKTFQWRQKWSIDETIAKIVEWNLIYLANGDVKGCMEAQIKEYLGEGGK